MKANKYKPKENKIVFKITVFLIHFLQRYKKCIHIKGKTQLISPAPKELNHKFISLV